MKLTNNVILKSILIFFLYYFIINGLSALIYITLGRYIVEKTTVNLELISLIDTFVFLVCSLIFYFAFFNKQRFLKKTKYSNSFSLKDFILISSIILTYKIVADPIYRIDFILGNKNFTELQEITVKPIKNFILFFNTVLIAPVLEELVFRNLVLKNLIKKKNILVSILISSILYSFIHINLLSFNLVPVLNGFLIGLIFSIIYLRFKIIYSIIAHILFNFIWFLLELYKIEYWNFEKSLGYNSTYWIIVIISFFILAYNLYYIVKKKGAKIF